MRTVIAVVCSTFVGSLVSAQEADMGDLVPLQDPYPARTQPRELRNQLAPDLISDNGSIIFGSGARSPALPRAPIVWDAEGAATLIAWDKRTRCDPEFMSADGSVLIAREGSGIAKGWYVWNEGEGPYQIQVEEGVRLDYVRSLSADGARVLVETKKGYKTTYYDADIALQSDGSMEATLENREPDRSFDRGRSGDGSIRYGTFNWSINGEEPFRSDKPRVRVVHASRASDDRAVVVLQYPIGKQIVRQENPYEYAIWTEGEDPTPIIEVDDPTMRLDVEGVSDGATILVGVRWKLPPDASVRIRLLDSWIYTDDFGLLEAGDALELMGVDLGDQRIRELTGVSADGTTIIGTSVVEREGKEIVTPFVVRIDG